MTAAAATRRPAQRFASARRRRHSSTVATWRPWSRTTRAARSTRAPFDAVREAAVTRLRPVLMTSVATVCGHFPLTLVTGPGAAARNSIGLVLVAGMTIGTAFTLFFVPAIYLLIARDHRREARANGSLALEEGRPAPAGP